MTETKTASQTAPETSSTAAPGKYNYAIGYLRAFIVALVVAHHTALGYLPALPPANRATLLTKPQLWLITPVVDPHRWALTSPFIAFNDTFFMSLMFFLSGLFFWHALQRKGVAKFLRDRLLRLGIPLLVAIGLFSPIAYYPSYLQTTAHTGIAEFCRQWLALGFFPTGPAWFVGVLLLFDAAAALLFTLRPAWATGIGSLTARVSQSPLLAYLALIAVSALVYIPMALVFTPFAWTGWGLVAFQTSRILHYFAYFLIAVGLGAAGIDRGLLAPNGKLAAHWLVTSIASLVTFAVFSAVGLNALKHVPSPALTAVTAAGFVLSCAAACFACLALFLRFMQARRPLWDSMAANSYGIYLVHYMFVSWLQYALLPASFPGFAKFPIAFVGALALSWIATATLRRIPAVARIV